MRNHYHEVNSLPSTLRPSILLLLSLTSAEKSQITGKPNSSDVPNFLRHWNKFHRCYLMSFWPDSLQMPCSHQTRSRSWQKHYWKLEVPSWGRSMTESSHSVSCSTMSSWLVLLVLIKVTSSFQFLKISFKLNDGKDVSLVPRNICLWIEEIFLWCQRICPRWTLFHPSCLYLV